MMLLRSAVILVTVVAAGVVGGCGFGDVTYGEDSHWVDPIDYPDIGSGKILITNSASDTLSWIDLATMTDTGFVEPVGRVPAEREGPHHGAALPDGSAYFIGISNVLPGGGGGGPHGTHGLGTVPGYLLKYDTATHELIGERRVDRSPGDVRITPDGKYVLQSHFDLLRIQEVIMLDGTIEQMYSRLAIIDADTMALVQMVPVCPAAHGIAISADSSEAYVACYGSDELAVVTLAAPWNVVRYHVGPGPIDPTAPIYQPYAIAIHPVDRSVWVSCIGTSDLRVFEPDSATWRTPVPTSGKPFFAEFSDDGARLFVPTQGAPSTLTVHDGTTGAIQATLVFTQDDCVAPHAVFLPPGPAPGRALVVCEGNHSDPGQVAIVNIAAPTPGVESSFEVGVFPDDAILLRAP